LLKGTCAKTFSDNDLKQMKFFIEKVVGSFIKNKPLNNSFPDIENYSRMVLTKKLINIISKK